MMTHRSPFRFDRGSLFRAEGGFPLGFESGTPSRSDGGFPLGFEGGFG
ncbi:hypothetical protein RB614_40905 [Phytohabitans sp. ZYX-F-186]|uniref:Uncharacterized protein n=1 Tax=Phytohabitans maris TaxID=3071409 RepID=A0ABU0ZV59_9ACTN|nr:hypothetical protein [Phytohabitans sp. ZYX-F-186]MDQ7910872.1 hypothetical protein [Phytohabitans sp. ZYX-F-186]